MSDIQALDSTKITLEEINLKKEELKEIDESIQHYQDIIKFANAIKELQADENYKLVGLKERYFKLLISRLSYLFYLFFHSSSCSKEHSIH